jgi:hypothetical protein
VPCIIKNCTIITREGSPPYLVILEYNIDWGGFVATDCVWLDYDESGGNWDAIA